MVGGVQSVPPAFVRVKYFFCLQYQMQNFHFVSHWLQKFMVMMIQIQYFYSFLVHCLQRLLFLEFHLLYLLPKHQFFIVVLLLIKINSGILSFSSSEDEKSIIIFVQNFACLLVKGIVKHEQLTKLNLKCILPCIEQNIVLSKI